MMSKSLEPTVGDNSMENIKPSFGEDFTDSLATQAALALIAASNPSITLAPLLPVLANTFAAMRYKDRIEQTLQEINKILQDHEDKIRNITDEQYQIINDLIVTCLQTTNKTKLKYLKHAVSNSIIDSNISHKEASIIGRIIRDLSAEEAHFLIKNFKHEGISYGHHPNQDSPVNGIRLIYRGSQEESVITGLMSLGLLVPANQIIFGCEIQRFADIVAKILVLLKEPNSIP